MHLGKMDSGTFRFSHSYRISQTELLLENNLSYRKLVL